MLLGTEIGNNEYEATNLTPYMSSHITPYATFAASKTAPNSVIQATDTNQKTFLTVKPKPSGERENSPPHEKKFSPTMITPNLPHHCGSTTISNLLHIDDLFQQTPYVRHTPVGLPAVSLKFSRLLCKH